MASLRLCVISLLLVTFLSFSTLAIGVPEKNGNAMPDLPSKMGGAQSNLVANWSFSEGSGIYANDTSGRNNNGTLIDFDIDHCWDGGVVGTGLEFDGINDHVEVEDSQDFGPQDSLTVSVWVNPTKNMPTGSLVSKRDAFILYPGNLDNKITFYIYDGTWRPLTYTTPIELNQWTHITGVYGNNDNIFKLYINGKEVATSSANYGAIADDGGVLTIGRDDGISRYFKGAIDEVRIYNTTLNATQIGDYYNSTISNNVLINTSVVPRAVVNSYYETHLKAWGGTGSHTWSLVSGTLPSGIALATDGNLSGTPTQFGTFPVEVQVTDPSSNTKTQWIDVNVQNDPGLQLELLMEDGSGSWTKDTSGTGRNGSLINMDTKTCWVDGLTGNGLSFDGIDDYVVVPDGDGFDNQDNITVSAWIYPTANMQWGCIVSKRDAFILAPGGGDNKLSFYVNDGAWRLTPWSDPVDLNQWTHVAGVYGNTDNIFKLYINGVEAATDSSNYGAINNDQGHLYIGWDDGLANRYFKGRIDEVMIYNTTLNSTEIGDYYNDTWEEHLKGHVFMEKTTFPTGMVSQAYDHGFNVLGGTGIYTWSLDSGQIPRGLSLTQSGNITGKPTENGVYSFEIRVTDTNGSTTKRPFTIIIIGNETEVVGDWDFDSKDPGLGLDLSGYWNNATLHNIDQNTNSINGKLRKGIRLDGVDDYIRAPHSTSLGLKQNITVEVWARAGFVEPYFPPQPEDAIPISNLTALQMIGSSSEYPLNGYYYLTNNISAGITYLWNNNKGFDPIGSSVQGFTGTFDGRGYIISRLYINRPTEDYIGLFAYATGARIVNLGMEGVDITGKDQYIGTIAGRSAHSTFFNCYATGEVTSIGDDWWGVFGLGGMVGVSDYTAFYSCYTDVTVNFYAEDEGYGAGGLVGMAENGRIENCYTLGSVTAERGSGMMMMWWSKVGGMLGYARYMNILNSYAAGDVTTDGYDYVGGMVGQMYFGSIVNSYATGNVDSMRSVGGLVGSIYLAKISHCYATGNLIGLSNCGGLIGYSGTSTINNSYATGYLTEVAGTSWDTGGLVGELYQSTVSNCYSYNNWVSGDSRVGGLVGLRSDSNVINCYSYGYQIWGSTNVGGLIGMASGSGSVTSSYFYNGQTSTSPGGGTPKSSAQLQMQSTYVGWDFEFDWSMGGPNGWGKLQRPWQRLVQKGVLTVAYSMHLNEDASKLKVGVGAEYLNVSVTKVYEWHQYAMTYNGTNLTAYIDGVEEGTLDVGTVSIYNTGDVFFGGVFSYLQGAVDEVRIINGSLSAADVKKDHDDVLRPPEILTADVVTAYEDVEYLVDYEAIDLNNDPFYWVLSTNAPFLSIDPVTGVLSGTPDQSHLGDHWVNVTAVDPFTISEPRNFTLTVLNTNDAPIINTLNEGTVLEDVQYLVDYDAIDVDPGPDTLTWTLFTDASWLSMNSTNGILSGTPTNADVGVYSVSIEVNDTTVTDKTEFTLEVVNVNDDPVIDTIDVTSTPEDSFYFVDYDGHDIDPTDDLLIWNLSSNADWLSMDEDILSGHAPANESGTSYWVNVSLSDGLDGLVWTKFSLTITPVNDAPVITFVPEMNATEDSLYTLNLAASDVDVPDNLTWSMLSGPDWLSVTGDVLEGTPENGDVGTAWVTIEVHDSAGAKDSVLFSIDVTNTNDAPYWTIAPMDQNITEFDEVRLYANALDIDVGDSITYSISCSPAVANLSIDPNTGLIEWLGTSAGLYELTVGATDGTEEITAQFSIEVNALPVVVDPEPEPEPEENITTIDTDTDGDGIPDWWEEFYGLDPNNASDASQDDDNDNMTNLEEYNGRTSPLKDDTTSGGDGGDGGDGEDGEGGDTSSNEGMNMVFIVIIAILAVLLVVAVVLLIMKKPADGPKGPEDDVDEEPEDEPDENPDEVEEDPDEEMDEEEFEEEDVDDIEEEPDEEELEDPEDEEEPDMDEPEVDEVDEEE